MRLAVLAPLAFALVACSSSSKPADAPSSNKQAQKTQQASDEAAPPGTVARKSIDNVLLRGPAWLLGRVETEEVLRQNKFVGWRLVAFPADWDRTGLQPGDVVTELNGVSLEKPEDFWNAWVAMSEAEELRIAFERDGKPAMTVVKIHGAPVPDTKGALESGTMASAAPAESGPKTPAAPASKGNPKRKETVVITDESAGGDDESPSLYY